MEWKPIEGLPENWRELADPELGKLLKTWRIRREQIKNSKEYGTFEERLKRSWSIETGIIEGLYYISRSFTKTMIEVGLHVEYSSHGDLNRPKNEVANIVNDHFETLQSLYQYAGNSEHLSTNLIKDTHKLITRSQKWVEPIPNIDGNPILIDLKKGEWKSIQNSPSQGITYCPPEHNIIEEEMQKLVKLHFEHIAKGIPIEVQSAWLHHRFTQIHPFQDGNGRTARALASLIFIRGYLFPLIIDRDERDQYIEALEDADRGNLKPLVKIFSKFQKRELEKAFGFAGDSRKVSIIGYIEDLAEKQRVKSIEAKYKNVEVISKILEDIVYENFTGLSMEMGSRFEDWTADVDRSDKTQNNHDWYKAQIFETANKNNLRYYVNFENYQKWLRLRVRTEGKKLGRNAELVISFHGFGYEFAGIIAVSAFAGYRNYFEMDGFKNNEYEGPNPACNEIFKIFHEDNADDVKKRFKDWLEEVIQIALIDWNKSL
ncbi:MAG: Fic family protein [Caldisericia bacterium]|nr:Fic family protein [Caldisericia bacterium]